MIIRRYSVLETITQNFHTQMRAIKEILRNLSVHVLVYAYNPFTMEYENEKILSKIVDR